MMKAPVRTMSITRMSPPMYVFLFLHVLVGSTSAIIVLAGHREQVLELGRDHSEICKLAQDSDFNRVARHLEGLQTWQSEDRPLKLELYTKNTSSYSKAFDVLFASTFDL